MPAIEVFKTDLLTEYDALKLRAAISASFPNYAVNFDLSDCDHIMRVVSPDRVDVSALIGLALQVNVQIAPLPDEIPA